MNKPTYKLTFLPIFEKDLIEVTSYIANTLQNTEAAHQLLDDIETAIEKRLVAPLSFAPFQSSKQENTLTTESMCEISLFFM